MFKIVARVIGSAIYEVRRSAVQLYADKCAEYELSYKHFWQSSEHLGNFLTSTEF